ncbi:MAG: TolC family protein [Myxococcota bacterium]
MVLLGLAIGPAAPAGANSPGVDPKSPAATDGHADLSVDASLSLAEAVRIAASREPGRLVVEARGVEAEAFRRDAGRWLSDVPSLVGAHVTDAVGSDHGYRQWDAALELPLWWPGQRAPRRAKADAAGAAAGQAAEAHRLEVAGRVRAAVAALDLTRNRLELARSELDAEEALAARVARAVELGELAERDRLLALSASLERRTRYLEALEEHRHAQADYTLLTGLDRRPARWGETLAQETDLERHPELILARTDVAVARAEVERLERARWSGPVVAIGSQHERDDRGNDYSHRLVAGIRIPLGRRDAVSSGLAGAQRRLAEARRTAGRLAIDLEGRRMRAEHALSLVADRIETDRQRARMADDHLQLTERGFALGEVDLATLVRARARAIDAQQSLREAEILQRMRIAQYNQALGVVP